MKSAASIAREIVAEARNAPSGYVSQQNMFRRMEDRIAQALRDYARDKREEAAGQPSSGEGRGPTTYDAKLNRLRQWFGESE